MDERLRDLAVPDSEKTRSLNSKYFGDEEGFKLFEVSIPPRMPGYISSLHEDINSMLVGTFGMKVAAFIADNRVSGLFQLPERELTGATSDLREVVGGIKETENDITHLLSMNTKTEYVKEIDSRREMREKIEEGALKIYTKYPLLVPTFEVGNVEINPFKNGQTIPEADSDPIKYIEKNLRRIRGNLRSLQHDIGTPVAIAYGNVQVAERQLNRQNFVDPKLQRRLPRVVHDLREFLDDFDGEILGKLVVEPIKTPKLIKRIRTRLFEVIVSKLTSYADEEVVEETMSKFTIEPYDPALEGLLVLGNKASIGRVFVNIGRNIGDQIHQREAEDDQARESGEARRVIVSLKRHGGFLEIKVRDRANRNGFPKEILENEFMKGVSHSKKATSSGIGMYYSVKRIREGGGVFKFGNNEDEGAWQQILLPIKKV